MIGWAVALIGLFTVALLQVHVFHEPPPTLIEALIAYNVFYISFRMTRKD